MGAAQTETGDTDAPPDDRPAPSTPRELLAAELRPGDPAVRLNSDEWYIVVERLDAPAGAIASDYGGTLDEWHPVDAEAEVVAAVPFSALDRAVVSPRDVEGVRQLVDGENLLGVLLAHIRVSWVCERSPSSAHLFE